MNRLRMYFIIVIIISLSYNVYLSVIYSNNKVKYVDNIVIQKVDKIKYVDNIITIEVDKIKYIDKVITKDNEIIVYIDKPIIEYVNRKVIKYVDKPIIKYNNKTKYIDRNEKTKLCTELVNLNKQISKVKYSDL